MYVETLCSNFSIICILSATNGENVTGSTRTHAKVVFLKASNQKKGCRQPTDEPESAHGLKHSWSYPS